ncbi:hypothetical protein COV19_06945 [Candidatus Woesearchaeota archaeon CG10_big_fil_rev_8_21_14_0_10_44_13]|nr:MAG: hypothetical protein COV19_06945 [Candidatus Woesearchaeota archaeon CG10_big_fil_rev_8_21_14_0_10_44_13]
MIITSIKFKSIKVLKYSKEGADIRVCYDTGDEKSLSKNVRFDSPEALTEEIFREVKEMEKRPSRVMREMDSDGILEGIVVVKFFDEERSREKMKNFFERISDRAKSIRNRRECTGYLDMINQFQGIEFKFD